MRTSIAVRLALLLAGTIAITASPAKSQSFDSTILFQDTGDTVSVSVNGVVQAPCEAPEVCRNFAQGSGITATFPINFNIYEDSSFSVLSDTLSLSLFSPVQGLPPLVEAVFTSDLEGSSLTPLANATNIVETGDIQTVASLSGLLPFNVGFTDTYEFQSDIREVGVPEPPSILLLLAPLIGLAFGKAIASVQVRGVRA